MNASFIVLTSPASFHKLIRGFTMKSERELREEAEAEEVKFDESMRKAAQEQNAGGITPV